VGTVAILTDLSIRMMWWNGGRVARTGDRQGGVNPLAIIGFILLILAPIVARIMQAAMSRRRETLADVSACQLTRYTPGLIAALEKLREAFRRRGVNVGGGVMAAGNTVIVFDNETLTLFDADPAGYKPRHTQKILEGKCWTSPVIANGRIYCRNAVGDLACVEVMATAPETASAQ
jgi:Zn-dependent protease with chaperone function